MSGELGFIKLLRGDATKELFKDPKAFTLVSVIAYRARYTDSFSVHNLRPGEALIGDYKSYGMTRQEYRTALKKLKKWKIITAEATSNGTVVRLVNGDIYDLNLDGNNQRTNQTATIEQPSSNHQATTNKKEKERKESKKKRERFRKPTAEEVVAYAESINFQLDGQVFIDFYESKDWMIGKNRMKDWRAAVRTWRKRSLEDGNKAGTNGRANRPGDNIR